MSAMIFEHNKRRASITSIAALMTCAIVSACSSTEELDGGNSPPDAGAPPDSGTPMPDAGAKPDASTDGGTSLSCAPATIEGRIDNGSWDTRFNIPGLTGFDGVTPAVHGLAQDTDGSVLAAGYFIWAGDDRVGPLARFDGNTWSAARNVEAPDLSAVAVSNDGRIAISTFRPLLPTLPPTPQLGEIFVDEGAGLTSVGRFDGIVRSLAWFDGALWAGGFFQLQNSGPTHLAVWRNGVWSAPDGGAANGPVYVLFVEADRLHAGGSFSQIGGIAASSIAEWDGTAWRDVGLAGFEPTGANGPFQGPIVYGLARDGAGVLHAGGFFYPTGMDPTSGGVARFDGAAWEVVGAGLADYGGLAGDQGAVVSDLVLHDGAIYAAGCFSRTGGDPASAIELPGVARWTGTIWEALPGSSFEQVGDPWFHAGVCGNEPSGTAIMEAEIQRMLSAGSRLYIGGAFSGLGGEISKSLIAHDGERWLPLETSPALGLSGFVSDLAVGGSECTVHVFGGAPPAGVDSHALAYRFDGDAWVPLGGDRPEGVSCSQIAVTPAGEVYIGCNTPFDLAFPVPRIFRRDGDAWTALPEIPGVQGALDLGDLEIDPAGRLWVVGGIGPEGFIARWDGDQFTVVEDQLDGTVIAIDFQPGDESPVPEMVIGGTFANVRGVPARGLARWDGTSWQMLGEGSPTPVFAVAYVGDTIYASGSVAGEGEPYLVLGRWTGSTWEELGVEARGLPPHIVEGGTHQFRRLLAIGSRLIAAGDVQSATGGRHVFVFDGERFTAVGGGANAISIETVIATPDAIWVGGSIATTGNGATLAPSIGVARFELGPATE